jgi:hypothetical protein
VSIVYLKRSLSINPEQPEAKELLKRLKKLKKTNGNTVEEIIRETKPKRKYKGNIMKCNWKNYIYKIQFQFPIQYI